MSPLSSWIVSLLIGAASLSPEAAAPRSPEDPAGRVLGERARRQSEAFRLYQAGRFAEAALEFESLWDDFHEPGDLYNAASSRAAVGHNAHVARYLQVYLTGEGLAPESRRDASHQLEEARRGLVDVPVRVTGEAADVEVVAEHVAELASDIRPPLRVDASSLAAEGGALHLDPGTWRVMAVADDGRRDAVEVVVSRGAVEPVTLMIGGHQTPPGGMNWRGYTLGFVVGGGVVAGVGVGLLAGTGWRGSEVLGRPVQECDGVTGRLECRQSLARALNGRAWGAGLVGAGAGAIVGGLTARLPDGRRRQAWIIEASVGGVTTLAGVIGLATSAVNVNRITRPTEVSKESWTSTTDDPSALRGSSGLHTASGALAGLGIGLVSSAVTGLVLEGRGAERPVAVTPTWGGLSVSGRF
ncbi:MAG TPA: hypothetical protein PKW35_01510 [Nannocystaceae bacterium]|nr:hypothetical protein [Nannocystaceae bacterium]